jgi:hypothetical protein
MALGKCRQCGAPVSLSARFCPSCGCSVSTREQLSGYAISLSGYAILFVVGLLVFVFISRRIDEAQKVQAQVRADIQASEAITEAANRRRQDVCEQTAREQSTKDLAGIAARSGGFSGSVCRQTAKDFLYYARLGNCTGNVSDTQRVCSYAETLNRSCRPQDWPPDLFGTDLRAACRLPRL